MKTFVQQFPPKSYRANCCIFLILVFGVGVGLFMSNRYAFAQDMNVPWECSGYTGDAQTRCVSTLMELQQEKITRLEEQLKKQEGTVNQLKEQLDRQASALNKVQPSKQDSRYPAPYVPGYAYPYGSSYGYIQVPPNGIYLQPPWRYPRYYGFGPGYWGYGPPGVGFTFRFGGGHRHHQHW
jgi:uncharacterized coiled-coil protein SlyX